MPFRFLKHDFMFVLSVLLITFSISSYAFETKITSTLGNNSNPLEVSESNTSDSTSYVQNDINLSEKFNEHLSASAEINARNYEGNMDKADSIYQTANIKLINWHRYLKRYLTIHSADLAYHNIDTTYVDNNGDIANFNGEDISDRYDREIYSLNQRNRIKLNNKNRILLSWFYTDTQYERYDVLSNLDNAKYGFTTGWLYTFTKKQDYELFVGKDAQSFDDKENRTSDGEIILDSDLKISSYDYGIKYKFNHNDVINFWLSFEHAEGTADDSGYYDYQRNTALSRITYQLSPKVELDLQYSFSDQNYHEREKNELIIDDEITAISSKNKLLSYTQKHQIYKSETLTISANLFAQLQKYSSNLAIYSYEQQDIGISLQLKF